MVLVRRTKSVRPQPSRSRQPCRDGLWTEWDNPQRREPACGSLPSPPLNDDGRCSVKDLRWSASNGCLACKLILDVLQNWSPAWKDASDDDPFWVQIYSNFYFPGKRLVISLRVWENSQHRLLWLLRRPKESPVYPASPTAALLLDRPLRNLKCGLEFVGDDYSAAVARIRQWLSHCARNCEGCQEDDVTFTPRRLIDVGLPEDAAAEARLYEPTRPSRYACLSFAQEDQDSSSRTTSANIKERRKTMQLSDLEPAFRDAINLCRQLGIPALWINTLCTITDDEKDCLGSLIDLSPVMSNSSLTIFGRSADEPLFASLHSQSQWLQRSLNVQIPEELGDPEDSLLIRSEAAVPMEATASQFRSPVPLQNEILAKRRLFLTENEMKWSCTGKVFCECGHEEGKAVRDIRADVKRAVRTSVSAESPLQCWRAILEKSTGLQSSNNDLTEVSAIAHAMRQIALGERVIPAARLEAVVAKVLQTGSTVQIPALTNLLLNAEERGPGDYVAGLWTKSFISDLAWSVDGIACRGDSYTAPTWSWASLSGSVKYKYAEEVTDWKTYDLRMKVDAKVENITCEPVSPAFPTGPLSSAVAELTGPVAEVEVLVLREDSALGCRSSPSTDDLDAAKRCRDCSAVVLVRDRNGNSCPVTIDVEGDIGFVPQTRQAKDCRVDDARDPLGFRLGVCPEPFYCLQLFTWENRDGRMRDGKLCSSQSQPWFLLLRKSRADNSLYERVGLGFWDWSVRMEYPYWVKAWLGDGQDCELLSAAAERTVKIV